jgi:hypothetical protein
MWVLLIILPILISLYIVIHYWNINPERRLQAIAYYLLIYFGKPIIAIGIFSSWWKYIKFHLQNKRIS